MALPLILKPKKQYKLSRLGNNFDGGYLVGDYSLANTEILLSFGINDDWSFEKDFKNKVTNCSIECYDDKPILKFLFKKLIQSIVFFPYKRDFKSIKILIYKIFDFFRIKKKINFIQKKIFYNDLKEILKKKNSKNVFLKIDIEGSEYRLLDEILLYQKNFTGIVIEFHDFDYHKNIICNFIKKLDLELIHIHPNNSSPVDKNNDPIVIEITFEKNPIIVSDNNILPNKLDMNNNPLGSDISLNFENI